MKTDHQFVPRDTDRLCNVCNRPRREHADSPPDQILDVRVSVPYGMIVTNVEGQQQEGPSGFVTKFAILDIHPAIDRDPPPAPIFEAGKTYRTRNDLPACVINIRDDRALEGWVEFKQGRTKVCWQPDGRMNPPGVTDCDLDLMPGAVEPEGKRVWWLETPDEAKRIRHEMEQGRRGLIGRLDRQDGAIAKLSETQALDVAATDGRINELTQRLTAQGKSLDVAGRTIDSLRSSAVENLQATDARLDRLSGIIDELDKRLTALAAHTGRAAIVARLEALEDARVWIDTINIYKRMQSYESALTGVNGVNARLDGVDRRMTNLGHKADGAHARIGAVMQIVEKIRKRHDDFFCIEPDGSQPKRTIKGGWLNVWAVDGGGRAMNPTLFDTKDEADKHAAEDSGTRIACIQIPDITEGEGL